MIITARLLLTFILVTLAGCSSSGDSPTRYYLIEPVLNTRAADSDLALAIVDLEVPQYLEKFQIASRRDSNQLVFATSHQWAENLRKNLSRVLVTNLSSLVGTPDVGSPANRSASTPDIRIGVSIEKFERGADGYVHLAARWQLRSEQDIVTHTSSLISDSRVDARDYAGTVSALNRLFARLSEEIANAIMDSQQ